MNGERENKRGASTSPVAVISFCWTILFIAVLLLIYLSNHPPEVEATRGMIELGPAVSLNSAPVSSFSVIDTTLIRVEDDGVAFFDTMGKEQSYAAFPYHRSRHFMNQDTLFVTPEQGGGLMLVTADGISHETGIHETVYGADYQEGIVLCFGASAQGQMMAGLFDVDRGTYRFVINFDSLEWPLGASFVPNNNAFDLLLLDLSTGNPVTKILRYDLEGTLIFDQAFDEDELFPIIAPLENDALCLLNEDTILLFNPETKTIDRETMIGKPIRWQASGERLVMLVEQEGILSLTLFQSKADSDESMFLSFEALNAIEDFAIVREGSHWIAAQNEELWLIDAATGQILARQSTDDKVKKILPLDSHHCWIMFEKEARLLTIR